jgi:putative transposase
MEQINAWRTGRHCIFKNIVHLIFVTKYRRDVGEIAGIEWRSRSCSSAGQCPSEIGCLEFGGKTEREVFVFSASRVLA